ncbi:MAG: hypothetical protein LC789_01170 [Actinobacteria bacterium]|nr:hypothetical protein [Actinomycetota bacterium]MCA1722339.1 hypothetical protein [Actinomycetota bacterium]
MGRRRTALLAAAALVVLAAPLAHADPQGQVTVTGRGGQVAQLVVGKGGVDLDVDPFGAARLPGGNGAVGGLTVQRSDGTPAGGVLLQNAPGFDTALALRLIPEGTPHLGPGRYRLTLLGSGAQTATLQLKGDTRHLRLRASGSATPVTRTGYAGAATYSEWSDDLQVRPRQYLVVGAGTGGDLEQADAVDLCVRAASNDACVGGDVLGFSPGAGSSASWTSLTFAPDTFEPGHYVFEGSALGIGPSSTTGHAYALITLRP